MRAWLAPSSIQIPAFFWHRFLWKTKKKLNDAHKGRICFGWNFRVWNSDYITNMPTGDQDNDAWSWSVIVAWPLTQWRCFRVMWTKKTHEFTYCWRWRWKNIRSFLNILCFQFIVEDARQLVGDLEHHFRPLKQCDNVIYEHKCPQSLFQVKIDWEKTNAWNSCWGDKYLPNCLLW